jgi:hypothetical protein
MSTKPVETFACFNERLGRIESAVTQLLKTVEAVMPVQTDPSTLKGAKRALYEASHETRPMVGKKICAKAKLGHSSHARRLLADLAAEGFLKKVRGGYVRTPIGQRP